MTQSSQFQPRQILCLEHGQSQLYAEVIQVVPDRPICWLRPLILSQQSKNDQPETYDLRLSSDLLMPPVLLRPAFDTELIPLLGKINSSEFSLIEAQTAHYLLRDFIQQVWQNHREFFP